MFSCDCKMCFFLQAYNEGESFWSDGNMLKAH